MSVRVRVPGKINLALAVGPRRADGYHGLTTVFHAVSLFETVTATGRDDAAISLVMSGHGSEQLPVDETNLAVRAAGLLRERYGAPGLGVDLVIDKQIPMAGGMAGGSADAAGVLLACNQVWGLGLDTSTLVTLAAELGSDVAFLLTGGNALGTGRGEQLRQLPASGRLEWVVALADGGLSTPAVYRRFDELAEAGRQQPSATLPDEVIAELTSGVPERVAAALTNALQPAALDLRPELTETLAHVELPGVLGGVVCGSGPTIAFVCADAEAADRVAAQLAGQPQVRATARASGPVSTAASLP